MTASIQLDIGSDSSQNFLRAWQAWLANPQRSRVLHFVVLCSRTWHNPKTSDELKPLAGELDAQLWGMVPGFHRLTFASGQVLLTLCIGDIVEQLRQQQFEADSICLNSAPATASEPLYFAKAIARLCRRGTLLTMPRNEAMQAALRQCGFVFAANVDEAQATFNPRWRVKKREPSIQPGVCVVIGAGLAGAAVASSLARRGWDVTVLDAASEPASGASSLPAGLLVPHTSPDDSGLSRLSRTGVRMTLEQARRHLHHGTDWGHTGVLERTLDGVPKKLPAVWTQDWPIAAEDWSRPAAPADLIAAGLSQTSTALWHEQAAWVKPAALVHAWLATPGVSLRIDAPAALIKPAGDGWQILDAAGNVLADAQLVVLASGYDSQTLAAAVGTALALQPIRGQVTWGLHAGHGKGDLKLPAFPVNGHGGFIPAIPGRNKSVWLMGSTYERDAQLPIARPQDNDENFQRLQALLPQAAKHLADQFKAPQSQDWTGIRCATPNRLPLLGQLPTTPLHAKVWVCAGMGSRGLTFASLCGELLAAQLHGEPLPTESRLAKSMAKAMETAIRIQY